MQWPNARWAPVPEEMLRCICHHRASSSRTLGPINLYRSGTMAEPTSSFSHYIGGVQPLPIADLTLLMAPPYPTTSQALLPYLRLAQQPVLVPHDNRSAGLRIPRAKRARWTGGVEKSLAWRWDANPTGIAPQPGSRSLWHRAIEIEPSTGIPGRVSGTRRLTLLGTLHEALACGLRAVRLRRELMGDEFIDGYIATPKPWNWRLS